MSLLVNLCLQPWRTVLDIKDACGKGAEQRCFPGYLNAHCATWQRDDTVFVPHLVMLNSGQCLKLNRIPCVQHRRSILFTMFFFPLHLSLKKAKSQAQAKGRCHWDAGEGPLGSFLLLPAWSHKSLSNAFVSPADEPISVHLGEEALTAPAHLEQVC